MHCVKTPLDSGTLPVSKGGYIGKRAENKQATRVGKTKTTAKKGVKTLTDLQNMGVKIMSWDGR